MHYFTLELVTSQFCYFEPEDGNKDQFSLNSILSRVRIIIKSNLTVGDGRNTSGFIFVAQNNFKSKVRPKKSNLYAFHGKMNMIIVK